MKIAVLADIHSNIVAFEEVNSHIENWDPDLVIVAGDIINRGPNPIECVKFLQQKSKEENWIVLIGNHEEYVIDKIENLETLSEFEYQLHKPSIWTGMKLDKEYQFLKSLPQQYNLEGPDHRELRIVHGSMVGNRDGIYPETPNDDLLEKISGNHTFQSSKNLPSIFCVGHTHRPFIKIYRDTMIINVGSVGLSFDGDPRLAYAQLYWNKSDWNSRIIRLNYDISRAEHNFHLSGYIDEAGPLVKIVLTELQKSRSLLYYWASKYQDGILNGTISVSKSVNEFLTEISDGSKS